MLFFKQQKRGVGMGDVSDLTRDNYLLLHSELYKKG